MSYESRTDDQLLGNLLRHGQDRSAINETEPSEDLFELFVEGKLSGDDEEEFYRYLDANPEAREAASLYLASLDGALDSSPASAPTVELSRPTGSLFASSLNYAVALAACLLLALGVALYRGGDAEQVALNKTLQQSTELLASGQFDEAAELLKNVPDDDPRGRLLSARAAMREAGDLESSEPWSLLAYGYELGDAVTMDGAPSAEEIERLKKASDLVDGIAQSDSGIDLAQGWMALKRNDPAAAAQAMDSVLAVDPDQTAALLGRGVAYFMLAENPDSKDELEQAVESFRRAVEADPGSFAARINLAKALSAKDEYAEPLEILRAIDPAEAPSDEVRRQIAAEIERLRELLGSEE